MELPTYLVANSVGAAYWIEDDCLLGAPMLLSNQPDLEGSYQVENTTPEQIAAIRLGLETLATLINPEQNCR